MHIGFLTSEYPHELTGNGGGIGTSIKNLAAALVSEGCRVTVFVLTKDYSGEFMDGGTRIVTLPHHQYRFLTWYLYRKDVERWLNEHIICDGVQVLEVADWTGITAFMHLKCPVVMKFHGSDTYFCYMEGRKMKFKNRFFECKAAKNADAYIGVSQFALDLSSELLKVKSSKPKAVIYNGLDLDTFRPTYTKVNPNLILNTGTLIRKKGSLEIPYIFNLIVEMNPDAQLMLVGGDSPDIKTGSSSTWELMKPLFNGKALANVNYKGKVPYKEILDIVNSAAVCIFPSYAEAFPVSWLECMACGKAMVTSDVGWANEIINNGRNGYMVHPSKHHQYANAVTELLQDSKKRKEFGKAARQTISNQFSAVLIAKESMSFYSEIVNSCK